MLLLALAIGGVSSSARADEASDFEKGRKLYVDGKHLEAVDYFAKAIDGATPTLKEPSFVNRGRMIRGASDMYLGKKADAIAQFEEILRSDPKFAPDPLAFPPGVLDEFKRTHDRLEKEAAAKLAGDKQAKEIAALRLELGKLIARYEALKAYAREERVVTTHSRVIASLPFGVGQFQNGENALGVVFATTEAIAFTAATISWTIHESIPRNPSDLEKARSVEISSRFVNIISVGAFVALAIGGVIQAHIAYVPDSYETRQRPLPASFARIQPIIAPTQGGASFGLGGVF